MLKKFQVFNTLKHAENTVKWLNNKYGYDDDSVIYEQSGLYYSIEGKKVTVHHFYTGCGCGCGAGAYHNVTIIGRIKNL